jgi:hypothetical protein
MDPLPTCFRMYCSSIQKPPPIPASVPPGLKPVILHHLLRGHKWPLFHRFFALKREETRAPSNTDHRISRSFLIARSGRISLSWVWNCLPRCVDFSCFARCLPASTESMSSMSPNERAGNGRTARPHKVKGLLSCSWSPSGESFGDKSFGDRRNPSGTEILRGQTGRFPVFLPAMARACTRPSKCRVRVGGNPSPLRRRPAPCPFTPKAGVNGARAQHRVPDARNARPGAR